jgi:hypothetical protein
MDEIMPAMIFPRRQCPGPAEASAQTRWSSHGRPHWCSENLGCVLQRCAEVGGISECPSMPGLVSSRTHIVSPASQIFFQSSDRSRNGFRVIAECGLQIASVDEFGDQLLRSCLVGRPNNFAHGVLKQPIEAMQHNQTTKQSSDAN